MSDEHQVKAFEAPEELRAFVERFRRDELVYIGWGSMGAGTDRRLCQLAVAALRHANVKAVVQGSYSDLRIEKLRDPGLIAYAESNIYFVHKGVSIPHSWLFPLCGVCVHHGGVGTVAACLYAGTPSIVTPVYLDQYYWANCIQEANAGLRGPGLAKANGRTLGACISTCMENLRRDGSMAGSASSLGNRMRSEDGVGKAVDFVEKFCKGEWPDGAPNTAEQAVLAPLSVDSSQMDARETRARTPTPKESRPRTPTQKEGAATLLED
jgi:UDP:flavonoid glycosyltransferase YjiC (YdhE family)